MLPGVDALSNTSDSLWMYYNGKEERQNFLNDVEQSVCHGRDVRSSGCGRKNDMHRHYYGDCSEMFMVRQTGLVGGLAETVAKQRILTTNYESKRHNSIVSDAKMRAVLAPSDDAAMN